MASWNEGDVVRVVSRPVTDEDRKKNRYFEHLAGLRGTVQNVFDSDEVSLKVDEASMSEVTADVVRTAAVRMREKFLNQFSEEQRRAFTKEEAAFVPNYVIVVRNEDLEAA